jgi:integrase
MLSILVVAWYYLSAAHDFVAKAEEVCREYASLFLCALRTGMRLGELIAQQWADVDFAGRFINVRRNRVAGEADDHEEQAAPARRHVAAVDERLAAVARGAEASRAESGNTWPALGVSDARQTLHRR